MKNKRVKQMICDVYGCRLNFWVNRGIYHATPFDDKTSCDALFFGHHYDLGLMKTLSLTANQLKGVKVKYFEPEEFITIEDASIKASRFIDRYQLNTNKER